MTSSVYEAYEESCNKLHAYWDKQDDLKAEGKLLLDCNVIFDVSKLNKHDIFTIDKIKYTDGYIDTIEFKKVKND